MNLQQISFVMFAAAASGGLLFTVLILLVKHYPRALAAAHGFLGVSALVVLGTQCQDRQRQCQPQDGGLSVFLSQRAAAECCCFGCRAPKAVVCYWH